MVINVLRLCLTFYTDMQCVFKVSEFSCYIKIYTELVKFTHVEYHHSFEVSRPGAGKMPFGVAEMLTSQWTERKQKAAPRVGLSQYHQHKLSTHLDEQGLPQHTFLKLQSLHQWLLLNKPWFGQVMTYSVASSNEHNISWRFTEVGTRVVWIIKHLHFFLDCKTLAFCCLRCVIIDEPFMRETEAQDSCRASGLDGWGLAMPECWGLLVRCLLALLVWPWQHPQEARATSIHSAADATCPYTTNVSIHLFCICIYFLLNINQKRNKLLECVPEG